MKYGERPTSADYDYKTTVRASDSYVGSVLYRYGYKNIAKTMRTRA
jgi:hypothetical protein